MIVKFHARGTGKGSGPVDYLLGKDMARVDAKLLRGASEEVIALIDSSPYAKKYTSGVLSFAEADLASETKQKVMDSFERALLPGLDADQYSVLWVEHRDKGRLELNFVIPNIELQRGKRLQPYFDRADRPRIDAWQTVVNAQLGLHDPNDPLNQRALVTANSLPREKQAAAEAITHGLLRRIDAGEIKNRADVVEALRDAGFSVVRQAKNSISLASPDGGQNLRLKGAIYGQDFRFSEGLRAEIDKAGEHYRSESRARVQSARERYQYGVALKRAENQQRYPRAELNDALDGVEKLVIDRGWSVGDVVSGRERAVVARDTDTGERAVDDRTVGYVEKVEHEDVGHSVSRGYERSLFGVTEGRESEPELDVRGRDTAGCQIGEEVNTDDSIRAGIIERLRGVTAELRDAATSVVGKLQRVAADVHDYFRTGGNLERAEHPLVSESEQVARAGKRLEWSGAELKQASVEYQRQIRRDSPRFKGLEL